MSRFWLFIELHIKKVETFKLFPRHHFNVRSITHRSKERFVCMTDRNYSMVLVHQTSPSFLNNIIIVTIRVTLTFLLNCPKCLTITWFCLCFSHQWNYNNANLNQACYTLYSYSHVFFCRCLWYGTFVLILTVRSRQKFVLVFVRLKKKFYSCHCTLIILLYVIIHI